MQALFKTIIDGFREDFGYPASLIHALDEHDTFSANLDASTRCIDAYSIVPWHELGAYPVLQWPRRERGVLTGWKAAGQHWENFQTDRAEYAQLGQREITEGWSCDITEIDGFSSSKSDLQKFAHTDQMVEANSREMINEISQEKLTRNLAHKEIRILHDPDSSDHFVRYRWDDRLWLMNDGGSHHMAAAKYIASRLDQPVKLTGKLHTYSLNAVAIASLRREFEMFAISNDSGFANAFFDAMRAVKATWLWHPMPRPLERTRAILLPKAEARSMRVAEALHKAGVADLGAHLSALADRQR